MSRNRSMAGTRNLLHIEYFGIKITLHILSRNNPGQIDGIEV